MTKDPYSNYHKANQTVSEIQQVIMLYEGAINSIEQAKTAMNEGNPEGRYNSINKAISIVSGLNSCLEFNDETEEIANALDQYYQSIDTRLLFLLGENNPDQCDKIIDDLRVLLNAWKDVAGEGITEENSKTTEKITVNTEQDNTEESEEKEEEKAPYPDLSTLEGIELDI